MSSYHGQTSKPRNKVVKPILKKFERTSIDLDRPAAEQQDALGIYAEYGTGPRSARDVSFDHGGRRGYHARSTSGTSQFSTGTAGSHRAGSFVHPFQQTPRPYTPPLGVSYQPSLRESEYSKDSPALTEDELEGQDQLRTTFRTASNLSSRSPSASGPSSPVQHALRIQTKPSFNSRLGNSHSHTNLASTLYSPDLISPTDTMSPISAVRTSMDKGFRKRTRSDAETRPRSESIQEARRKFEEKERVKEEKAAREEIRKREKADQKEARQIEKGHRRSSASERPQTRSKRSKSDLSMPVNEKDTSGFVSRDYNSVPIQSAPWLSEGGGFEQARRDRMSVSTKKKSHGAWTKFMMWLRTRLLRMKKSESE